MRARMQIRRVQGKALVLRAFFSPPPPLTFGLAIKIDQRCRTMGEERARHTPVSPHQMRRDSTFFPSALFRLFVCWCWAGDEAQKADWWNSASKNSNANQRDVIKRERREMGWNLSRLLTCVGGFNSAPRPRRLASELNPLLMISGREPSGAIFDDGKAQRERCRKYNNC